MGIYGKFKARVDIAAISAAMQDPVHMWYNATIRIVDPDIEGAAFNRVTNKKTRTPVEKWSGPARIQAMRWPNVATTRQEAISNRAVVFHIPLSTDPMPTMIPEGWRVEVTDGGMAPEFVGGLFVITSGVNTSYAWDRRIETVQDMGS